jgi:hypothetical protein
MAINFPSSPAVDDEYTVDNVVYKWDGVKWINVPSETTGGGITTGKAIAMAIVFG